MHHNICIDLLNIFFTTNYVYNVLFTQFQAVLDQVEDNIVAAQEENTNATRLLDEAQKFLDAANKALEVSLSCKLLHFYPAMLCIPTGCTNVEISRSMS